MKRNIQFYSIFNSFGVAFPFLHVTLLLEAAALLLRPILMTDIVGIIGLLPLALSIGEGTAVLKPMSIAVIGGLVFGLLLVFQFLLSLC